LLNLSAELFSSWSQVLLWPRQDLLTFPPPSSTIGCWTHRVHCTLSSTTRVHSAYVTATSISLLCVCIWKGRENSCTKVSVWGLGYCKLA
jgi:hypothetical protein